MIVIPAIDIMSGKCVRLTRGVRETKKIYDQDPISVAKQWADFGVRRIHVVDLDGAFEGEGQNLKVIERIVDAVDVPVQVGGGIRTERAVKSLLEAGVSYIVIGTIAVENASLAADLIEDHSGQIYVGVDTRAGNVTTHGWMSTSEQTHFELIERAAEWQARGIVFTAIERDGEMIGPDFEAIEEVAAASELPIIASGGVAKLSDLQKLSEIQKVEGAIVGKALYEGSFTLNDALTVQVA